MHRTAVFSLSFESWGLGTGANTDTLMLLSAIAVTDKLSFISDPGVSVSSASIHESASA